MKECNKRFYRRWKYKWKKNYKAVKQNSSSKQKKIEMNGRQKGEDTGKESLREI